MERGLSKNQIIAQLTRSPHGKLEEYLAVGLEASRQEPEFTAHLIAWNHAKGQIRDSKTALPVIHLSTLGGIDADEFNSNALAHLSKLDPRNLLRAIRFAKSANFPADGGFRRQVRRLVHRYLRHREENWALWERTAVQHRRTLKEMYALLHVKPSTMAESILFHGNRPKGTVFEAIANLKDMSATEAAGTIMQKRIPFLIASGALGAKMKDPDTVLALIQRMTPTELVTNTKMLNGLGVKDNAALRSAFEEGLKKAAKSKKNVLKTTRAAKAVGDEKLAMKLQAVQEKQMDATAIEGNWLVLGDRSPSMVESIDISRHVAATLARMAKGAVSLVFFDGTPYRHIDATGKTYEEILAETRHISEGGNGTCIGCGLLHAMERHAEVDGIAIVSDAQENTPPFFKDVYTAYCQSADKQIPVYLYRCHTPYSPQYDLANTMRAAGHDLQEFDLRGGVDYYSLPNVVQTMRTNRYSLVDEIMATPLLDLDIVLPPTRKEVAVA